MGPGTFDLYLIAVNVFGFVLFAVMNGLMKAHGKWSGRVLIAAALAGASLGLFVSVLIFDRGGTRSSRKKDIMLSRVVILCLLVMQTVAVLIIKGFIREELTFDLWGFLTAHPWLPVYLITVNAAAFAAFGTDKRRAVKNKPRIRIVTLLSLAFIGGSVGALIGMHVFRHKTAKDYFFIGVPMMLAMQALAVFYFMNIKI